VIARMRSIRRHVAPWTVLLALLTTGATGCGDSLVASGARDRVAPAPFEWELTPLQQQLLMQPVSPEDAAGRPATRADLEEARSWFGPGELETILAIVNRNARASGADTLPHCFPVCGPGSPATEPSEK
jgi:hypothetical protein